MVWRCREFLKCSIFFFQAEDGIRDQPRSRGLGDVYKRQACAGAEAGTAVGEEVDAAADAQRLVRMLKYMLAHRLVQRLVQRPPQRPPNRLSLIHI